MRTATISPPAGIATMPNPTTGLQTPPALAGYTIDPRRAREFRDGGKLLTMRLETSRACDLQCIYCNTAAGVGAPHEIALPTMQMAIHQARDLGAESVVIIGGGEPLLYRHIRQLIAYVSDLGLIPVIITNGSQLTDDLCAFLCDNNASILLKCDSLDRDTQDLLAGRAGAHATILRALDRLMRAGFATSSRRTLRIGLSFVVTKINYEHILPIWKLCRDNALFPNFEEFIPRGRGFTNYDTLFLDNGRVFALKQRLLELDRTSYGYDWLIHTPLPGHGCLQTMCSVYVTSSGRVQPCPDIDVSFSNVHDASIEEIIKTPFFRLARNLEKHLQGKCGSCEHGNICIGCRGNAFSVGIAQGMSPEDALCSPDPLCLK
jgi:radical SAM protein with 4Fe4S-binding SPASM domain